VAGSGNTGHSAPNLDRLHIVADSTGQRNGLAEPFSRRLEAKGLSWPFVQLSRHGVELGLRVARDVDALGQVLPEQAVRVLVAAALPRAAWIAEVDLDVGGKREPLVTGHLFASVPRE
jgi:hypothetical protein